VSRKRQLMDNDQVVTSPHNPVAKLRPTAMRAEDLYVDIDLGVQNPSVSELWAACAYLEKEVPGEVEVVPDVGYSHFLLVVRYPRRVSTKVYQV
jgi:hypothetical protein